MGRPAGGVDRASGGGSDQQEIDVGWGLSGFAVVAGGPRPEDRRRGDPRDISQGAGKDGGGAEGLCDESAQFVVDGGLGVRRDQARPADALRADKTRCLKTLNFPVDAP